MKWLESKDNTSMILSQSIFTSRFLNVASPNLKRIGLKNRPQVTSLLQPNSPVGTGLC